MYINTRPFLHTPHSETKRYQKHILNMLKDIDKLSQKHSLDYTLEAGSALGAARHKGFIPWDNDADILLPENQVKKMLIAMARDGLFKKYEIWYYSRFWSWLVKDVYIARILEDPDEYSDTSLNWVVGMITHAVFRIVKKDPLNVKMSLSKKKNTYQVAHFDTTLTTASPQYKFMTLEEKRVWRERYLLDDDVYAVHPFVDVFPVIEMTPDEYIDMKKSQVKEKSRTSAVKVIKSVAGAFLAGKAAKKVELEDGKFEDYRVGVDLDYVKAVEKANKAKKNKDNVVLSKAPWNLKKIIPYEKAEIYPPRRLPFETTELNGPNKIVDVLNNHFKDYTQMPPEDQRIQHVYHLDPSQFPDDYKFNQ